MEKINLSFNDGIYKIEPEDLQESRDVVKNYLGNVLAGQGEEIEFEDVVYNIDTEKLQLATNKLIDNIVRIGGEAFRVVVDGIEYKVSEELVEANNDLAEQIGEVRILPTEAGLYEKGKYHGKKTVDWETLINDGVVRVTDGVFLTNFDIGNYENSSNEILVGDLILPEGITSLGNAAFGRCNNIDSFSVPSSLTRIEDNAVWLTSIKRIYFPENSNLTYFGTCMFCDIVEIDIPEGVTYFGGITGSLVSITLPSTLVEIRERAFERDVYLKKINYRNTVAKWLAIEKGEEWDYATGEYVIYCTDGKILKDGTIIYYPTPEEPIEGDGQNFHQFAPTALTFWSTEPLEEFMEVQVNGETVDPENYTLEEGSTIVTLKTEYLKTLGGGKYEIAIVSQNKTASGNFDVTVPEVNEHGFYYNQPYTAYVDMFGENESFFIRDDGTLDVIGTPSGDVRQCTYTCSGNSMTVISPVIGTLTAIVSDDGTEIFCNELQIAFTLGNDSIVADDDYIYIYSEELGGYEVKPIDMNKSLYASIRTDINGRDTVKIADWAFCLGGTDQSNTNMVVAPEIPDTVTTIGTSAFRYCNALASIQLPKSLTSFDTDAFFGCNALTNIIFEGTVEQWDAIAKYNRWYDNIPATYVQCSDGQIAL